VTLPENTYLAQEEAPPDERLDRQVRIPGWNQEALAQARVGVVGDDPWLTGLLVTSAAALGINRLTVVAPDLDPRLVSAAQGLNPELNLAWFPGFYSHFLLEDLLRGGTVLIDLGHHGLGSKLLLNLAHREGLPLVRGYGFEEDGVAGLRLFTYQPGREWRELLTVLPRTQLPALHQGDPVLALVTAGLVLEETKKLLLGEAVTPEVISYSRASPDQSGPPHPSPLPPPPGGEGEKETPPPSFSQIEEGQKGRLLEPSGAPHTENRKPKTENSSTHELPIAVVGAGALGNFVGLGLAALGFTRLTFIDPDPVEVTNLNRQVLFWDAVGQPKAEALAQRITEWFGAAARAETAYVTRDTDLREFAVVFDGTDNFESRIILSEKCREQSQILISGGTGVEAGQVVVFDPVQGGPTPAELLGLYDIVGQRDIEVQERERASCVYAPEAAIIMTNQIVGGLMVDTLRRLLNGEPAPNLFYDARSKGMI
jgi:molybdopterin/thiamine biosynthesis adenylyltransferase